MIWSEVQEMTVSLSEACGTVSALTGTPAKLINTGGNCGALEARVEGGYILVTDGDVFFANGPDVQSFYERWVVGVYSDDEHLDCLGFGYGPDGDDSMPALAHAVLMALNPATRDR